MDDTPRPADRPPTAAAARAPRRGESWESQRRHILATGSRDMGQMSEKRYP